MRVTSKGQVTIPKRIRDKLGIFEGTEVAFEEEADGRVVLVKKQSDAEFWAALKKVAGTADAGLSTAEIMRMTRGEDWIEVEHYEPFDPEKLKAVLKAHEDRKNAEGRSS